MDAGLLDVLHHAADRRRAGPSATHVDVDLDRVLEELVDEQRIDRVLGVARRLDRARAK